MTGRAAPGYLSRWDQIAIDYRRRASADGFDHNTIDKHLMIVEAALIASAAIYAEPMGHA